MTTYQQTIAELNNKGYDSYKFTMTFKFSKDMQEQFPDYEIYQANSCKYTNGQSFMINAKLGIKLELISRQIFNKLSMKLLESSNITRTNKLPLIPILFYRFEQMTQGVRATALMKERSYSNLCPVHCHALMMIKPDIANIDSFTGDNKLLQLSNFLQSSELKKIQCIKGQEIWFSYINKGSSHDFFYAYGGTYPSQFESNPEIYLSNAISNKNI